jgi:hypothetical protein
MRRGREGERERERSGDENLATSTELRKVDSVRPACLKQSGI